eukprot:1336929-Pleurochrysis_carterae.AAC.1
MRIWRVSPGSCPSCDNGCPNAAMRAERRGGPRRRRGPTTNCRSRDSVNIESGCAEDSQRLPRSCPQSGLPPTVRAIRARGCEGRARLLWCQVPCAANARARSLCSKRGGRENGGRGAVGSSRHARLLEPDLGLELDDETRDRVRGGGLLVHGAVHCAHAVDGGGVGPAGHAQVYGDGGRAAVVHADRRHVAKGEVRRDVDAQRGAQGDFGGRVVDDCDAAVGCAHHEARGELWPALVEVGGAAAKVGLEAVRLCVVAVVRPHVRRRAHRVDLVDRLQVLVGPHVAALWRGPRGG